MNNDEKVNELFQERNSLQEEYDKEVKKIPSFYNEDGEGDEVKIKVSLEKQNELIDKINKLDIEMTMLRASSTE